jgi:hypothetical protein
MKKLVLAFMVMAWFVSGCASFPKDDIKVDSEADPKANLSGYKTYAWLATVGIVEDAEGAWEPQKFDADAELEYLINANLRDKGLTQVNADPDLFVAYALGVNMDALKVKTDPDTKLDSLKNVPQAALVVVLIDPETGFATWMGVATGEVKNAEPEIAKQRLGYAVNTMFKGFKK